MAMPPLSLVALELAPTATVFLPPVLAPLPPLRRFQPKQWHQYPMPSHCQHLFTLALLPNTTALSEFFTSENAPAATPFSDKTVDVEPIAPLYWHLLHLCFDQTQRHFVNFRF
ncbi:hypothetical protein [Neisseria maigaei]|uniref:hypothetical protein n=1 Tax=Neisseria maigaei TaxID=2830651 RepID=UPI00131B4DF7|nr:hypothetical protein [Neisseria maigaei]